MRKNRLAGGNREFSFERVKFVLDAHSSAEAHEAIRYTSQERAIRAGDINFGVIGTLVVFNGETQ